MKALVLAMVLFALGGVAYAADAKPAAEAPWEHVNTGVDTMCQNKVTDELCKLPDGGGGICRPYQCTNGSCLKCIEPLYDKGESNLWIVMLAFGVMVMLVGSVFWWRLKKLFNETPDGGARSARK